MTTTTTGPAPASTARHGSRGRTIFIAAVGVVAGAGLAAGIVLGLGGGAAAGTPDAGTTPPVVTSTSGTHAEHGAAGHSGGSGHGNTPAAPSAAIETLQHELGQLNYYEGPITGTMTPQTTQAIEYLQRDAHLPQTGRMDTATQAALANFLVNGNNQMAG